MKIAKITVAGSPKQGEQLPRAMADFTRDNERWIDAVVYFSDGNAQKVSFRTGDDPASHRQRREAACEVSRLLEGTDSNADSYLSIVDTLIHLA